MNNIQKTFTDSASIVKAIREGDWDVAKPSKPRFSSIDFRKIDAYENLVLDASSNHILEDNNFRLETIKSEYEVKKIEYTEELMIYNNKLRQYENNTTKTHAKLVEHYCSKVIQHHIEEKLDF